MSNQSSKALASAIGELRSAAAQMKQANTQPKRKAKAGKKARARKRARLSAGGSAAFSPIAPLQAASSAYARARTQSAPTMMMSRNGEVCTVRHREYVGELTGASAFTVLSYSVNPGLATLFQWLSQVASRFEKYRFRRLRFCYESESASTQVGSVVLAIDYNALDAAPVSKQQAMAYKSSVRCAPWQEVCLNADLASDGRDMNLRFVRNGAVPSGQDAKTYDLASFFLCTQNSGSASGELYVEYEVELHTPTIMPVPAASIVNQTGNTPAKPLGTSASIVVSGNAPIAVGDNGTNSVITFNAVGYYLVSWLFTGTVLTGTGLHNDASTVTIGTNNGAPNSAATADYGYTCIQCTSPGQQLIFDFAGTTVTGAFVVVSVINAATYAIA